MGFLNGRVTYVRYRVGGDSPLPMGEELIELAQQHLIGRHGAAEATDGISVGWAGGEHVLDTTIDLIGSYYREDDNRLRVSNQLCQRDPTGVLGCLPGRLDFSAPAPTPPSRRARCRRASSSA